MREIIELLKIRHFLCFSPFRGWAEKLQNSLGSLRQFGRFTASLCGEKINLK